MTALSSILDPAASLRAALDAWTKHGGHCPIVPAEIRAAIDEIERLRAPFLALAAAQDDFDREAECEDESPARYSHAAWKMEVARRRFFRMAREEAEKAKGSR